MSTDIRTVAARLASSDKLLYLSVLLFLFGLFALDANYATKLFYIPSAVLAFLLLTQPQAVMAVSICRIFILLALFVGYLVVSSAVIAGPSAEVIKHAARIIAFVVMLALVLNTPARMESFFGCIIIFTILGSFPDVYSYITSGNYSARLNFGIGMKFLWHTLAGGVYAIASLMALHKIVYEKSRLAVSLSIVAFLYLCCLVYLTQSRGAILSLAVALAVFVMLGVSRKKIFAVIVAATIPLFYATYRFSGVSMMSLLLRKDASRLDIWAENLHRVAEVPLFGFGLNAGAIQLGNSHIEHPHNLLLSALVFGGVIGLILLVCMFTCSMVYLFHCRRSIHVKTFTSIMFCALFFSMFDVKAIISNAGVVWILLWLPIGLSLSTELFYRSNNPIDRENYVD